MCFKDQSVCVCVRADILFASLAVEEAGPLEAGLLAAHPEDGGNSYDQHHQVLDQEQDQVGTTGAVHLQTHRCGYCSVCVGGEPPASQSNYFQTPCVEILKMFIS